MGSSSSPMTGLVFLLASALAVVGLAGSQRISVPAITYSVSQLKGDIHNQEANWDDPSWNADLAHERDKQFISRFITEALKRGSGAGELEKNLTDAINDGMPRTWAEIPARVIVCCSGRTELYVVGFTLDEAAGESLPVIQIYQRKNGSWRLTSEGGDEMEGCDMDLLLLPSQFGDVRVFTHGQFIGANQAPTLGVLYSISGDHIRPIWSLKNTDGLSAKVRGDKLVLEYQDDSLYYDHRSPNTFRDEYVQSHDGLTRISHRPVEW